MKMILIVFLIVGTAAIIFSILAWRLRNHGYFMTGIVLTGIVALIEIWQYELIYWMIRMQNILVLLLFFSFIGVPAYFLIMAKQKKTNDSFDGIGSGGQVTTEYLDKIINSEDEEIDYEEDLDLR